MIHLDGFIQIGAALCAGIAAFAFTMLVVDLLNKIEVEKATVTDDYKRIPIFFRFFMPFIPNILPLLRHELMQDMVKKSSERVGMAGYDMALSGEQFAAIRILMGLFGIIIAPLLFIGGQIPSAMLFLMIMLVYPNTWLNRQIRTRHTEVMKALPNVLDLLTLSVEAGRDFLTAMRDIVGRRKNDALGAELRRALHEIQLGKQRQVALREMAERVKLPDLTTVINAIIQAEDLGVSIAQLLRVQGDQLRVKRFTNAEKLASATPVKILMPIIVCIFPCVFLILMGPLMAQALKSFGS